VPQLATTHFASTSIDGFSKNHPPQSFAQLFRDDHVCSRRRAAGSGCLQSPDLPPPPAHRSMPTFWAPKSVRASPQVHRPIDRFDQFHRRGTILTFLWQYSTRQVVSLQTMRRRPEYGHPPKTPPSPAVEGKRHSHLLPSTTESREFRTSWASKPLHGRHEQASAVWRKG
jgi:hypothetical protein